jgi:hypothetical protein
MKIDKDTLSLSVAILSFALSSFAIYQTSYHDKISIKPVLGFFENPDDSLPEVGITVENDGLGPAIIQSVDIFVDHTKVKDWQQAVDYCHIKNPDEADWYELEKGDPIRVSQSIPLFFRPTKNRVGLDSFVECIDKHLGVFITYDSLDGEHFTKCSAEGHC